MKSYLFILGRNFELSRSELVNFCDETFSDKEKSLFIGENLKFENPRNIPRAPEQLFLDRLGGTIRYGEIIGEFFSKKDLLKTIWGKIENHSKDLDTVPKVGFSVFGGGKDLISDLIYDTKKHFKRIRVENYEGKSMSSGQIFERRLLRKGQEFIVWKNGNSFLLAKTVANQNIRNYTLRDRDKIFRDPKMGMLPPKLAQILINLANPNIAETIIDPFCGSGTLNIEAAIMGYKTVGSDWNNEFVKSAQKNFDQMAEKFRYDSDSGKFLVADATQIDYKSLFSKNSTIVTEGYLGKNFDQHPSSQDIAKNKREVLALWTKVFRNLDKNNSTVTKLVFCLPAWNQKGSKISFSQELFTAIKTYGYEPQSIFGGQKTFFYEREDAFVAREICIVEKK